MLPPEDDALPEAEFVRRLGRAVRHAPDLQPGYKDLFPAAALTEAMLPLVARALGRTIGVIDADAEVVAIPHQWFAPATHAQSVVSSGDGGDGLDEEDDDDDVEVLRRQADGTGYVRDYDDEYVAKYEAHIQSRGWTFATDGCAVHLRQGDTASSSSSTTVPAAASSSGATSSRLAGAVNADARAALRHDQKGVLLYEVWGGTRPFVPGHTKADSAAAVPFAPYPSVTDPAFHPKLYRCRGLRPSDVSVRDESGSDGAVVRCATTSNGTNFMSPVTPYHSLLLMHATGTARR